MKDRKAAGRADGGAGLDALGAPVRAFVALPCPDGLRRALARALGEWGKLDADVAWTDPRKAHFTLRFLADADPDRLRRLDRGLAEVARGASPIAVRAGSTGAFPGWRRPRVLWLGAEGDGAVERLAEAVEAEARRAGFDAEERPFTPHLTLGRARSPRGVRRAVAAVRGWEPPAGAWRIEELVLFRSRLEPSGARHDPLSVHRLGGRID